MRTEMRLGLLVGLVGLFGTACSKDDQANNTQPPAAQQTSTTGGSGTTPPTTTTSTTTTTTPAGNLGLAIYTDDLQQGGAFLYPGGDNQTLAFNDTSNPSAGTNSMRYFWNGGDVAGQHIFAGVDLIHSGSLTDYNSTPGKDLRGGNYSRVTFNARGSLPTDTVLKIEVADDGNNATPAPCLILSANGTATDATAANPVASCSNTATLTGAWQNYSIGVTPSNLASVKDYFKATYIYIGNPATAGTGGTVFFDQILYQ